MKISVYVPDQYVDTDPRDFAGRMRLSTALLMFREGQLSAGAAAELAGVDRWTFVEECGRYAIPITNYPAAELAEEVRSMKQFLG